MVILVSKILKWREADKAYTEYSAGLTISQIGTRKNIRRVSENLKNKKGDSLGVEAKESPKQKKLSDFFF
ncbi:hypothetical protein [Acinetobacter seifertii]|uniref:hypothetical protein n=1 Tax=Acinetobacter seifertii TaxID=1530123 RepID=UPI003AF62BD1